MLPVGIEDIHAAAARIAGRIMRTPTVRSDAISRATGADVTLKLENLQPVGAFNERGAANRLALLTEAERRTGVIAVSAGNHAQAVARHARLMGIAATIVMPQFTPLSKVSRTAAWGAKVVMHGETLAESGVQAHALAKERGLAFIHPYDDPAIIAGQGTLALEFLQDAPDLDTLVIPVGGGGLISGCAVAAKAVKPDVSVIGVEVAAYSALAQRLSNRPVEVGGATVAEGIAVRDIGKLPLLVARALIERVVAVDEVAIEQAICLLLEVEKTVTEGAGAAGLAALLAYPELVKGRKVGLVLSGGNIDTRLLASILLRGLVRDGRIVRLRLMIGDAPGQLARVAGTIGRAGGNIVEVQHQRLFGGVVAKATELDVTVETRDRAHVGEVVAALAAEGFKVRTLEGVD